MSQKDNNNRWDPVADMTDAIGRGSFVQALDEAERVARASLRGETLSRLMSKIADARADCQMMRKSLVDGMVSPSLDALFSHMRQRIYALADALRLATATATPTAPRRLKLMDARDSDMADTPALIADYKQVALLGADGLDPVEGLCQVLDQQNISDYEAKILFQSVVRDTMLPATHRAYVLSVLAHNIITRHNRAVVQELLQTLLTPDLEPAIYGRAAVALAADMVAWPNRWADDAALSTLLADLMDGTNATCANILRHAIVSIAQERLALTVEHIFEVEMQNEMNIIVKKLIDKNPSGGSINLSEDDADEIFGFKSKKILGNLAKIEEWKTKGVDVGFVTMKHLKAFPFFKKSVLNWLRPFDPADPVVADALAPLDAELADYVANSIGSNKILPDSDKYSLIFGTKGLNANMVKEYCNTLNMSSQADDEDADEIEALNQVKVQSCQAADAFVKDLYRAARLCADEFGPADIFLSQCDFFSSDLCGSVFTNEQLAKAGLALVESRSWREAQKVYSILCAADATDANSLRKLAFCLLKTSDTQEALSQLRKADIVDDSDAWTKRMIAECHVELGQYAQAAYAIEQALSLSPHDLRLTSLSARCNEQLRRYATALADWREVAYSQPDNDEAAVGMARCLTLTGQADEAEEALVTCPDGTETLKVKALLLVARLKFSEAKKVLAQVAAATSPDAAAELLTAAADCLTAYGLTRSHILMIADSVRPGARPEE